MNLNIFRRNHADAELVRHEQAQRGRRTAEREREERIRTATYNGYRTAPGMSTDMVIRVTKASLWHGTGQTIAVFLGTLGDVDLLHIATVSGGAVLIDTVAPTWTIRMVTGGWLTAPGSQAQIVQLCWNEYQRIEENTLARPVTTAPEPALYGSPVAEVIRRSPPSTF